MMYILYYIFIKALGIFHIKFRTPFQFLSPKGARPRTICRIENYNILISYSLCQRTSDRRALALTALTGNGVSSRALRLLIACLGMVEERAAEWSIIDAGRCLWLLREKQEGVPLVVGRGGGGGCGGHFCLLSCDVWMVDGLLVARGLRLV